LAALRVRFIFQEGSTVQFLALGFGIAIFFAILSRAMTMTSLESITNCTVVINACQMRVTPEPFRK